MKILKKISNPISLKVPNVVGTMNSDPGLEAALRLSHGDVDLLELRTEAFPDSPERLLPILSELQFPLIVTARHPREGAIQTLSTKRRLALFELFLPYASLVDVELRSVRAMAAVIERARSSNIQVILSYHDFGASPSPRRLRQLAKKALEAGATILKVAATPRSAKNLGELLDFVATEDRIALSVMAMGEFGKVSRLLLAQAGSVLNYGFLDRAQVPGQWPAITLKERIKEILET